MGLAVSPGKMMHPAGGPDVKSLGTKKENGTRSGEDGRGSLGQRGAFWTSSGPLQPGGPRGRGPGAALVNSQMAI